MFHAMFSGAFPGLSGAVSNDFVVYTAALNTTTFDPSWTFSTGGGPMTVDWGDGSSPESHMTGLSHTYAVGSGTKVVKFTCPNWTKVTIFNIGSDVCVSSLPSFDRATGLTNLTAIANQFSGTIPSFSTNIALTYIALSANQFTGTLPSFASNTELSYFIVSSNQLTGIVPSFSFNTKLYYFDIRTNSFSGIIPNFSTCTLLTQFLAGTNKFTGYTSGSFSTQKSLANIDLSSNYLTITALDGILADLVTSLGISGRVTCTVNLSGDGNASPSSITGMANVATLRAAGWTVTINEHPFIITIGDSITADLGATWPSFIRTDYNGGVNHVTNIAMGMAKIIGTREDIQNMDDQVNDLRDHEADIVIVFLGTNDLILDETLTTAYETNINVVKARNPEATIYGFSILDHHDNTPVIAKNSRILTACNNTGITYIDTMGWINHDTDTVDGTHPNPAGVAKIVAQVIALLP